MYMDSNVLYKIPLNTRFAHLSSSTPHSDGDSESRLIGSMLVQNDLFRDILYPSFYFSYIYTK